MTNVLIMYRVHMYMSVMYRVHRYMSYVSCAHVCYEGPGGSMS